MFNVDFVERHKKQANFFIRNRTLNFQTTMLFLMNLLHRSIHIELGEFFSKIERSDTNIDKVSKSAFTQARAKLNHSAFVELNSATVEHFYDSFNYKRWNNLVLVAIDGSTLKLPNNKELEAAFGGQKAYDSVLARISEAYDPLNNIILDAVIKPYHISERVMMESHLDKLNENHLVIADRGYTGFATYKLHQSKNISYCIRAQFKGSGKQIDNFAQSNKTDQIIDLKCSRSSKARKKCKEFGLDIESIPCRLLKIDIGEKTPEILITSLIDQQEYPYDIFKELYHLRWPVEENYKLLKTRLELANFSGLSEEAILQDFHAKILMANITGSLVNKAELELELQSKNRTTKHRYKVNLSDAVQQIRKTGILLFIRENYMQLLFELNKLFKLNQNAIRDGRSFPRKKSVIERRYSTVYK